jgi:hypothetical protein
MHACGIHPLLVYEHGYGDRLQKPLPETRQCFQIGLGCELGRRRDLSFQSGRQKREPLREQSNYTVHFDKEALAPVSVNRLAVSSWMPLNYNADGSFACLFGSRIKPMRRYGP